jgi:hypothetical protein
MTVYCPIFPLPLNLPSCVNSEIAQPFILAKEAD